MRVLDELREGLREKVRAKWEKSERKCSLEEVEELVLKQWFDSIGPALLSNTTIGGNTYSEHLKQKKSGGNVEDFDSVLHERVTRYQNRLFDLRAENVELRKELPDKTVKLLENIFEYDAEHLARLESRSLEFSSRVKLPGPRRSVGGQSE